MDLKQAKQILTGMNPDIFSATRLLIFDNYLGSWAGEKDATLDGYFNADQLEAIATWMRNPSGVVEA